MLNDVHANSRLTAVHQLLDRTVERCPEGAAIDFLGRKWTWSQIGAEVLSVAAGLQRLGVQKGDRVGLCLPNTPYSVVAYFAVLKLGAVVVNYNPLYVERELEHQIRDSGTTVMFVIDLSPIHRKVAAVAERAGLRTIVVCAFAAALPRTKAALFRVLKRKSLVHAFPARPTHVDYATLARTRGALQPVVVASDDLAVLQYTGGTTGTPKGAELTHGNILANTSQIAAHDPTRQFGAERVLGVLPLFHVFAMTVVMNYSVQLAAEMILLPRYELEETLKTLVRRRVSVLPAVPTIYGAIAKAASEKRHDLSFVKMCISGGAPLPVEIGDVFRKVTGTQLIEGYGLTEASPVVACNPAQGEVKYGSVGRPLSGTTVEIRDPVTRALLTTGEKGELVVRGPQVMRGYWQRPAETDAVLDEYGLRTGDIGYKDEDGYIFIIDRIKDVILCGGYNVYPRVIEDALYQHPAVAEAIVIGVPDAYRGQAAKAFVVLKAGQAATPADLSVFLEDYISKIERPKTIEIRQELPKTAVGKLSRKELVAEEETRLVEQVST
jgi:long-chain acyl-CoA synthetase